MKRATSINGSHIVVNEKEYAYFGGTSYLGLPYNKTFKSYWLEGIERFGLSLGSSPLSKPPLAVFEQLEQLLAKTYGFKHATLFQSGYAAGQCIAKYFQQEGYTIRYSHMAHPAIKIQQKEENKKTIWASDFIDPVRLEMLPKQGRAELHIIDASHALGILDHELKKYCAQHNVVVTASLNKALGTPAGVVLHNEALRLHQSTLYSTASPPEPAACFALLKALQTDLVADLNSTLVERLKLVTKHNNLFRHCFPLPVLLLQNNTAQLFEKLKENSVWIWRNEYPKGSGEQYNRVVITPTHQPEDLDKLISLLNKHT